MRIFFLVYICIGLLACQEYNPELRKVRIYGHGGTGFDNVNGNRAPNSVGSISEAFDFYNLEGVEVDIQFTKEGDAIVYHDTYLESATQCKGKINSLSLAETKGCKYRKQFYNGYNEEVISLDSFASLVNNNYSNKYVSLNVQGPFDLPFTLDSVSGFFHQKLKKFTYTDGLSVECSDANFLYYLKQRDSTHRCFLIADLNEGGVNDVFRFQLEGIVSKFETRNNELEQRLSTAGKTILLYGHKLASHYTKYSYEYIDGVQTDNPILAIKYFRNK